jgi:hypothetical protein
MALNFQYAETKTAASPKTFTPELIAEFDEAWKFLKENQGHQATAIFETAEKRDKWFNAAKAYGAQHTEKVHVSKVKGTGSDDKTSGKLVFKMEAGADREKRIAEHQRRLKMADVLRDHGIEFKRGVGSNMESLYNGLLKRTPEERESMAKAVRQKAKMLENQKNANAGKSIADAVKGAKK